MNYDDFIILSQRNREFLEGQREFGSEVRGTKLDIIMLAPVTLILLGGVIENFLRFDLRILVVFITLSTFALGATFCLYKRIDERKLLYKNGVVVEATISKLEEIAYGDDDGHKITLTFMESKQADVIVNRSDIYEVGKKMLILYADESNFAVM